MNKFKNSNGIWIEFGRKSRIIQLDLEMEFEIGINSTWGWNELKLELVQLKFIWISRIWDQGWIKLNLERTEVNSTWFRVESISMEIEVI